MGKLVDNFVTNNAYSLIVLVFLAGLFYGEVQSLQTLEVRVDKKIKVLKVIEKDVVDLKGRVLVLETLNNKN